MEIIILILAGLFTVGHIMANSAKKRDLAYKEESKDELVQRMLNDYN